MQADVGLFGIFSGNQGDGQPIELVGYFWAMACHNKELYSEVDIVYCQMTRGKRKLHLAPTSKVVTENRLRFFGHAMKRPSDHRVHVVLRVVPEPSCKRPLGRTTISLKKTNITTEKHQVQDNEESYDEIEGQKSSTSQLNSKSIVIIAASALLIVFVLISIIVYFVAERKSHKRKMKLREQMDREDEIRRKRKQMRGKSRKKKKKRRKSDTDSNDSNSGKKRKKTQGTPSEKKGSSVRKAVADYLEAQLKTCVMAVDPEKAGGDVGTVKPEDLEDGGYFGTPKAENKQENAPDNKQETPAK
ncbi:hypothetical protein RB195_007428 [Necator americanus]|uniref:Uncharacterized protein n=1 Tax=Necator americanus TaxID=51031 RepID=A0ABR1BYT2_NECAM